MGTGRENFEAHERLEAEILQERAEALGRSGERLEEAIRRLSELRNTIEALGGNLEDATLEREVLIEGIRYLTHEYNALREKAVVYHRYLIIQREAVGFYDHRDVDRLYRIPDPIEESETKE